MEKDRVKIELMIMNWIDEIVTIYFSEDMKKKVIYDGLKAYVEQSVNEKLISSTEQEIALDIIEKYKVN